jgi:hypothetical protein
MGPLTVWAHSMRVTRQLLIPRFIQTKMGAVSADSLRNRVYKVHITGARHRSRLWCEFSRALFIGRGDVESSERRRCRRDIGHTVFVGTARL